MSRIAVFVTVLLICAVAAAIVIVLFLPEPDVPPHSEITVYFNNFHRDQSQDCSRVFPRVRDLPTGRDPLEYALRELFSGPSPTEREAGYSSFFSDETRGILRSARVTDNTVYIDLEDLRDRIPGLNSSCGVSSFFAQIESVVTAEVGLDRVILAFEGRPEVLYEWMQIGCHQGNEYCSPEGFR